MKIITALENEKINNKLKENEKIKIITKDIQYKEGILEILEEEKNIDYIFLKKELEGEISYKELIKKIKEINKNIKIILIINKKEKLEEYKKDNNIYDALYDSELNEKNILNIIGEEKNRKKEKTKEKKEQIAVEKIRKIYKPENGKILKKRNIKIKKKVNIKKLYETIKKKVHKINYYDFLKNTYKIKNIKREILSNYYIKRYNNMKKKNKKSLVLYTIGTNGVGKTTIIICLAKAMSTILNEKILIVDLDFFNNSVHSILGIKMSQTEKDIIKINKKIDVISFGFLKNIPQKEIENKINLLIIKYRKNYDYIFIDTNLYENIKNEKNEIMNNSDYILIISGTNLIEVNKTVNLINKINVSKNKGIILFNKYNKYSINFNLLKNIFKEKCKVVGVIKNNEKYNYLINKNIQKFNKCKKIRKEYFEIIKKIKKVGNEYGDRK